MIIRILFTLLCGLTSVGVLLAEALAGGPYVVNVGPSSGTLMWIVRGSEAALGTGPDQLTRKASALRVEKVSFSGLKPGQTYHYTVAGQADAKGYFKTPPSGPSTFRFMVYGDTRTRHDMHRKIIAAAVTREPDFVLHTGDLVQDGSDTEQWPIFFGIEKELLRRTVFFPSLGNHERNNPQYYEFFDVRTAYYSFNWGQAHIVVLNSDVGNITADEREAYWKRQMQWLEEDLARSQKAEFRFAVFHHPPYTAMARRQSGTPRSRDWLPLFEKYNVQAVFNGHDHNYQRHVKNGVQYITTGGGGAPLYPVDKPIPGLTEKLLSVEHIVDVTVTPGSARIEAVALDGSSIEVVELKP